MKIGMVLDDGLDKPDGVQQFVLTTGKWLTKAGHSVHYLVGHTRCSDLTNLHSLSRNLPVRFNKNRATIHLPVSKKTIHNLLANDELDVLHVQMPYSPFLAGRVINSISSSSKTAVVGTFHIYPYGSLQTKFTRALGLISRSTLRRFDSIMSTSNAARQFCNEVFSIESIVVPNPINVQKFKSANRLKHYKDGKLNIVFLGRLVERKGALELLQAVRMLRKQNNVPDFRVIMCGHGSLESKLQKFVNEHRLSQTVELVGFIEERDKADYLRTADIAVFPSLGGESFGIVLLEAMAAGAGTVIGGDNPGYRYVLGEREETLFNPSNTLEFVKILEKYMRDRSLRKRIHKWQTAHVNSFDINTVGPKIINVYKQALRRRADMR